jgi:hypothetical protein
MSRRLALVALLALALAPGAARAAFPVGLYPLRTPGLAPDQRADLHGLVAAALVSASRRGILQPRTPLVQRATCGEVMAPACLGAAAGDGLLLVGRGELKGGLLVVTAALYDRNGARTREVRFVADLVIQNLRPVSEALAQLELEIEPDGTVVGSRKAPAVAAPAPATAPATAPQVGSPPAAGAAMPPPAAARPAPAPALAARPVPLPPPPAARPRAVDVSAPPPALWKRQAGPLFTIVGGALLAGGATVAVLNRNLARDLDRKHAAGTLTAADRASYDEVDRYNVLTTVLLSAGGVSAAAGTWIWVTAPARPGGGAVATAGGRF